MPGGPRRGHCSWGCPHSMRSRARLPVMCEHLSERVRASRQLPGYVDRRVAVSKNAQRMERSRGRRIRTLTDRVRERRSLAMPWNFTELAGRALQHLIYSALSSRTGSRKTHVVRQRARDGEQPSCSFLCRRYEERSSSRKAQSEPNIERSKKTRT